jgi:SAM-dependent methyltransferase
MNLERFGHFLLRSLAQNAPSRGDGYLIRLQDFWLFIIGAQTDARLERLRAKIGHRAAFETLYRESADPWQSVNPRYRYQQRKYEVVMSFLPIDRHYGLALDLGCGLGSLARHLASRAKKVVGMDVAQAAVDRARIMHADISNLGFEQGDILDTPADLNGKVDLITITDTLYYLPGLTDEKLNLIALRIGDLLAPNGICLLTDHFFFRWDRATRLSIQIHRAFASSPRFRSMSEHKRPFYLTTLLSASIPRKESETLDQVL